MHQTAFSDNSRITHNEDIVPIVPGRFLGFVHSGGEKHIDPSVNWWACSGESALRLSWFTEMRAHGDVGQDNEADPQCSTGEVDNIFDGSVSDHDVSIFANCSCLRPNELLSKGPYDDGITMGC